MKVKENTPLFYRTAALVKAIPKGKVLSYGQVAQMIGAPGCARHVSFILSSSSKKYKLPWQRVVNSAGGISEHKWALKQVRMLMAEGVSFKSPNKIDLKAHTWTPTQAEIRKVLKGIPKHVSLAER